MVPRLISSIGLAAAAHTKNCIVEDQKRSHLGPSLGFASSDFQVHRSYFPGGTIRAGELLIFVVAFSLVNRSAGTLVGCPIGLENWLMSSQDRSEDRSSSAGTLK